MTPLLVDADHAVMGPQLGSPIAAADLQAARSRLHEPGAEAAGTQPPRWPDVVVDKPLVSGHAGGKPQQVLAPSLLAPVQQHIRIGDRRCPLGLGGLDALPADVEQAHRRQGCALLPQRGPKGFLHGREEPTRRVVLLIHRGDQLLGRAMDAI